jgi:hypothetical protein
MSYRSYDLAWLFLEDFRNTCSVCPIYDITKVRGFIRFNDNMTLEEFSNIKVLLKTRYGLTLMRHSYDDLPDIMKYATNKVIHYRNTDRFVAGVVMNG